MNFKNALTGIKAHFKDCAVAVLAEIDPRGKVQTELIKEGWQFKKSLTEEEAKDFLLSCSIAGPAPCIIPENTKVFTPEGEEVFTKEGNEPLEMRYKQAKRTAAAQVYGISK